jgi:hypothetical protein
LEGSYRDTAEIICRKLPCSADKFHEESQWNIWRIDGTEIRIGDIPGKILGLYLYTFLLADILEY